MTHVFALLSDTIAQLDSIWDTIGSSPEERVSSFRALYDHVASSCSKCLAQAQEDLSSHQDLVQQLEEQLKTVFRSLGDPGAGPPALSAALPLRAQAEQLDELIYRHGEILKERKEVWSVLSGGAYTTPEHFSLPSLVSLATQVSSKLQAKAQAERILIAELWVKVNSLWQSLSVSDRERDLLTSKCAQLENAKTHATTPAWCPLEIRGVLEAPCQQRVIRELRNAIQSLSEESAARIELQVRESRALMRTLCQEYYSLTHDSDYTDRDNNNKGMEGMEGTSLTLSLLEGEIVTVERRLAVAREAAELIRRKEELDAMRAEVELSAEQRRDMLTSKKVNMAQQLLLEERTRKTLKKEIPRLVMRMLQLCKERDLEASPHKGLPPHTFRVMSYRSGQLVDLRAMAEALSHDPYYVSSLGTAMGGHHKDPENPQVPSRRAPSSHARPSVTGGPRKSPRKSSFNTKQ